MKKFLAIAALCCLGLAANAQTDEVHRSTPAPHPTPHPTPRPNPNPAPTPAPTPNPGKIDSPDSKMAVGANFNVAFGDGYANVGFGAKFQYRFMEKMRAEAEENLYFPGGGYTWNSTNLNVHYLFPIGSTKLTAYPLAGVNLFGTIRSGIHLNAGVNYGAAIEYQITDKIKANVELKGQTMFSWGTHGVFSAGASYCF